MEKNHQFEEIAMKDTFEDLYAKIQPLIADKKYEKAREEVKKELYLLAGSRKGSIGEELTMVKNKFMAFLPEDMRLLLETERPEISESEEEKTEEMEGEAASEASDYTEKNEEIVAQMTKEGWKLMDIVNGNYSVTAEDVPEQEIKIIGNGTTKLVFARDKK